MLAVEPTSQQNFKSVYVIRVSKEAFDNPENIRLCSRSVDKALGGGGKLYGYIEAIKALFGLKPTGRVMTDINGSFIDAKEKEGMHTFSVITGPERDEVLKQLSIKNIAERLKIYKESTGRNADNKEIMNDIFRLIKWNLSLKRQKEIAVNSLEELKEYAGKL